MSLAATTTTTASDDVLALDEQLKRLVFCDQVQMTGLRVHYGLFTLKPGTRGVWMTEFPVSKTASATEWLVRRAGRVAALLHRDVKEFLDRAGAQVWWLTAAQAEAWASAVGGPAAAARYRAILAAYEPARQVVIAHKYAAGPGPIRCIVGVEQAAGTDAQAARDMRRFQDRVGCGSGRVTPMARPVEVWVPARPGDATTVAAVAQDMLDAAVKAGCVGCGARARNRCGACKITRYCSAACQRQDWPAHQLKCAEIHGQAVAVATMANAFFPEHDVPSQ